MTTIGSPTLQSTRVQLLPTSGQSVREPGKNGAFEALFAEKAAPTPDRAETDPAGAEAPAEDGEGAEQAEEQSHADGADPSNPEDGTGGEGSGETGGGDGPDADVSAFTVAGQTSVPVGGPPTPGGVSQGEQVKAQLKHAATVDLAELARREMLGTPGVDGIRPPPPPKPARPEPGPGASTGPTVNHGGAAASGGRGEADRLDLPRPIDGQDEPDMDTVKSNPVGGQPAYPNGKTPATGDPITASNQARQSGDSGPGHAQQQASQAASKLLFLDRLGEQSSARRGAVSAADRVVTPTGDSRPQGARPAIQTLPAERTHQPRDAFLAPVQKGLAKMLAQGGGRMTVLLRPERLGEVKIRMETESGAVRVRMEAGTEAAKRTLESGLDALRAALESKGVRVETMEIHRTPDASDNPAQGGTKEDADGRGQTREDPRHPEAGSVQDDTHRNEPAAVGEVRVGRTIWTELGIDAVA